jgi:hypothetical protein
MIKITVEGVDEAKQALTEFGKSANSMLNRILLTVAKAYKKSVISNYLSGQYLKSETGKTIKSMMAYRGKGEKNTYYVGSKIQNMKSAFVGLANIYEHEGGVDIYPKNEKILRFLTEDGQWRSSYHIHLPQHSFMTDSSNAFDFEGNFNTATETIIAKEIKKRGLE